MRWPVMGLVAVVAVQALPLAAIDLDVTPEDIERALAIARSTDAERARFHAPYIRTLDVPFVETVEVVSEFRRVVLLAEERARKGDRLFGYSVSQTTQALGPWRRRVSIVARMRFHPLNTYVAVPEVDVGLEGVDAGRVGVLREPILALPSAQPGDRQPILGALVEGVFEAEAVAEGEHVCIVRLDGQEVARVTLDLGRLR